MKNISIDNRLKDIASLVDTCNVIADIGTDHGYLPIYLLQNNIIKYAYASDVAIGPLNFAINNLKDYGLEKVSKTILTDGLKDIPKDVDTIIIAGMGGNLIIDILQNRKYDYNTYILQPNLHHFSLRKYLMENNFMIIDEKITYSHKKYYEIIKVKHGSEKLNELQLTFGPINLINKTDLFIKKWEEVRGKLLKVLENFKGSEIEKSKISKEIEIIESVIN